MKGNTGRYQQTSRFKDDASRKIQRLIIKHLRNIDAKLPNIQQNIQQNVHVEVVKLPKIPKLTSVGHCRGYLGHRCSLRSRRWGFVAFFFWDFAMAAISTNRGVSQHGTKDFVEFVGVLSLLHVISTGEYHSMV